MRALRYYGHDPSVQRASAKPDRRVMAHPHRYFRMAVHLSRSQKKPTQRCLFPLPTPRSRNATSRHFVHHLLGAIRDRTDNVIRRLPEKGPRALRLAPRGSNYPQDLRVGWQKCSPAQPTRRERTGSCVHPECSAKSSDRSAVLVD